MRGNIADLQCNKRERHKQLCMDKERRGNIRVRHKRHECINEFCIGGTNATEYNGNNKCKLHGHESSISSSIAEYPKPDGKRQCECMCG